MDDEVGQRLDERLALTGRIQGKETKKCADEHPQVHAESTATSGRTSSSSQFS